MAASLLETGWFSSTVMIQVRPRNRRRAYLLATDSGLRLGHPTRVTYYVWLITCSKFGVLAEPRISNFRFNNEPSIITTSTGISHIAPMILA